MKSGVSDFAAAYSPQLILPLLNRVFSKAGVNVVASVLQLFFLVRSPDVPLWAKTAICGALGYFIMTPDAIPDVAPILGFTDDLAVLTSALAGLGGYVTPELRARVKARLQGWFGDDVAFAVDDAENTPAITGETQDRS